MKLARKCGVILLCCFSLHTFADDNTPTDEVIKQQFAAQSGGVMRLETISLRPLEKIGNRATYMVEGDIISNDNLYSLVGMAGDYLFYERTWTKGHPVKFSAMMTAVGTKASTWKTEFFSMQTAAKNAGRAFSEKEDLSKSLVVNDSGFMAQFGKIDAQFATNKAVVEKQQAQYEKLKKEVMEIDEQITRSWGTDANGKPLDRSAVQQVMLEEMYAIDRQNDPLKFENNYEKTVYEPALTACQKKPVCDAEPLRAARDAAVEEQRREYYRQHNAMRQKIETEMAARDKKIEPLLKKRDALHRQMVELDFSNSDLMRDYKLWYEGTEKLRKDGVIP